MLLLHRKRILGSSDVKNNYGANIVVTVFKDSNGLCGRFRPSTCGFQIMNYVEGEDMTELQRLREIAKRYKEMFKPGTRIQLNYMGDDPRPIPPGTRGTVRIVDDMGTVHCDFDNGRQLGLIPGEDSFRALTPDELREELCDIRQLRFINKVHDEIIPCIDWVGMNNAYQSGDMTVPTELLRKLHEKFLEAYGTDHIEPSHGFVTVPGIVQAADGNLYPALLDVDASSSGEHYGTTFFTPKGVICDQSNKAEIKQELKKLVPYNYWYTVHMERDHHVNWNYCPNEAIDMIEVAIDPPETNEVKME